jgi:hypothetical protein
MGAYEFPGPGPTNAAPPEVAISISATGASVSFTSSPGQSYTLLYAENLAGDGGETAWTNVPGQSDVPGTGGVISLTDANVSAPQRFYRVAVSSP